MPLNLIQEAAARQQPGVNLAHCAGAAASVWASTVGQLRLQSVLLQNSVINDVFRNPPGGRIQDCPTHRETVSVKQLIRPADGARGHDHVVQGQQPPEQNCLGRHRFPAAYFMARTYGDQAA
jgi:hypothetical protein